MMIKAGSRRPTGGGFGAALFDLDGTIVHTDPLHLAAWNEALEPYDLQVDEGYYRLNIMGRENRPILGELMPDAGTDVWNAVSDHKEGAFRRRVGDLRPAAGFLDLLKWLEDHGFPVAVVTNAPRANAELMLGALDLRARLPVVVIGVELARGKPDPLPYLTGLERLGVEASCAIAFEDSPAGVRSAAAAGLHTFGMRTTLGDTELVDAGAAETLEDFRDHRLWRFLGAVHDD